jgi:elongation factor G
VALCEERRLKLVEACADASSVVLEKYVGEQIAEITEQELVDAIRTATLAFKFVPVLCGSAFRNKGVQPLLDAVVAYLPSPLDVKPVEGYHPKDESKVLSRKADDAAPLAALAFKITTDPFVGHLTYLRVYSGTLQTGGTVLNSARGKKERIGRLVRLHANKREDIEVCHAGNICGAVGLRETRTGDTLCAPEQPIVLELMHFPDPVISVAIEARTKADLDRLGESLQKLSDEDPSFRAHVDDETAQTIIEGMGELHLEVIVDRLRRDFRVNVNVGKPQVAYREAIVGTATGVEGRFVRQTGGHGQYGHVKIDLGPAVAGAGLVFQNDISAGVIPKEYIPFVEKGIKGAMTRGLLAGFPITDCTVRLFDGSYHDVDSSGPAFEVAGSIAFQQAAEQAGVAVLEPVMRVEVETPEEYLGDVIHDINQRRGRVLDMGQRANIRILKAEVPLAAMFGYATDLRSKTQGRADHTMQFSLYAALPQTIQEDIVARQRGYR